MTPVAPDYIEPIIGWRSWWVTSAGLLSLTNTIYWPVREPLIADCIEPGAPHEHCQCGIHAMSTRELLPDYCLKGTALGLGFAIGRVALWGKIIPGASGWRAEKGYPVELHYAEPDPTSATGYAWGRAGGAAVLAAYEVPTCQYDSHEALLSALGLSPESASGQVAA